MTQHTTQTLTEYKVKLRNIIYGTPVSTLVNAYNENEAIHSAKSKLANPDHWIWWRFHPTTEEC